jgi:DnaJ-class molecular chaperone
VLVRPCPECDGDGRVRTRRTIKVRIPAGVEDGTHIQLAGEGEVGPGGGPPGDLFLEIVQRPHAIFERQGDDLHCTVTIPMVAAALGATLSVESLPRKRALARGQRRGVRLCRRPGRAVRTCRLLGVHGSVLCTASQAASAEMR